MEASPTMRLNIMDKYIPSRWDEANDPFAPCPVKQAEFKLTAANNNVDVKMLPMYFYEESGFELEIEKSLLK